MTEATHVKNLIHALIRLPDAVITKYADRFTRDIPDLEIVWHGHTVKIEVKYRRKGQTLKDVLRESQTFHCYRLAKQSKSRCWIVVYHAEGVDVFLPDRLLRDVYKRNVNLPDVDGEGDLYDLFRYGMVNYRVEHADVAVAELVHLACA